jgi:hypothetical protein
VALVGLNVAMVGLVVSTVGAELGETLVGDRLVVGECVIVVGLLLVGPNVSPRGVGEADDGAVVVMVGA